MAAAVEMVVTAVEETDPVTGQGTAALDRVTDPAMVPAVEAVSVTEPDPKDRERGTIRTKL
jgi:hypothetical protein